MTKLTSLRAARILLSYTFSFEDKRLPSFIGASRRCFSTKTSLTKLEAVRNNDDEANIDEELSITTSNSVGTGISNVTSILGVRQSEARLIVKKFPGFNTEPHQNLSTALNYLVVDKGVPLDRILKNPWLLLIPPHVLEKRLKSVSAIISTQVVQVALPFIRFKIRKLIAIGSLWKWEAIREPSLVQGNFTNRIEYLAKNLNCSEMDVSDFMVRVPRLLTLPFSKIEKVLHLLLKGGVNPADVKDDPWIFVHNLKVMKDRMDDAQSQRLPRIKPWMLRCSSEKYESYVKRTLQEENVSQGDKNSDFLQRRLNWSPVRAKEILDKVPAIQEGKATRLDNMIRFLLAKGYSPNDIANSPRVLRHSVATVANKLSELAELTDSPEDAVVGHPIHSLKILCQSNKNYKRYLDAWKLKNVSQIPVGD